MNFYTFSPWFSIQLTLFFKSILDLFDPSFLQTVYLIGSICFHELNPIPKVHPPPPAQALVPHNILDKSINPYFVTSHNTCVAITSTKTCTVTTTTTTFLTQYGTTVLVQVPMTQHMVCIMWYACKYHLIMRYGFFFVPIIAILGIQYSQRFKDQQLYVIYKYVTSSNVGFVAKITY